MHIIELAKEAGFTVTGSRIESPYIGGSDISQRLADFAALVRVEYEKPLKLAKEALDMARKGIPPGSGMYGEALAAIREALADHVEQSLTMVADHSGDANKMVYSKPSVFDGVCCGCSKKAADGYALYCVECWEKSNGDPFAASGKLITKQDHIAGAGKVINADRELLELAAKAACYEVYWHHANQCYMIVEGSSERKWKPLSNGHDSLQLAAKLLMNVEINKASVIVCLPPLESGFTPPPIFEYPVSDYDEDFNVNYFRHYEATCLAILRAAAEIGKELP